MFKLFGESQITNIYCDVFETQCVVKALEDLKKDIFKISNINANIEKYFPLFDTSYMIVGSLTNERFAKFLQKNNIDVSEIKNRDEHYTIRTFGSENENLLICGSDKRGTMWGIYEFSAKFLGIDPLYFWTDNQPKKREELIISPITIMDGPKTYKFRGWFINDEDLLTGWINRFTPEKGNYFYGNYPTVLEKILETALRLKQNMIIPCSHLDVDDPVQENIIRIITERGLYISQHHQEPVGVKQGTIERYWREHGVDSSLNYYENPEKYEEVWNYYINKWAQYEDIIWQLGLRGSGDRPVWYNNSNIPDTMEARGNIISSAIAAQAEVLKKVYKGKKFISTSTLWMEGMGLSKEGHLHFPKDTIVVFADFGPNQMWGEGYYTVEREKGREHGVYYHVGFWGCGPHLVQGNSPEKIYYNYRDAVEKGDNCYSVLNVANIREHVLGIECVAEITWNIEGFNLEEFLTRWCQKEFGTYRGNKASLLYKKFYNSFYKMDNTIINGQMLFMDGMTRRVAFKLIKIINGIEFTQEDIQNTKLFDFVSKEEFINYYKDATFEGIRNWKLLYSKAFQVLDLLEEDKKQFFINNLIVQIEIILGLYSWVYYLSLAAEAHLEGKESDVFSDLVREAAFSIEKAAIDRKKAEQGKWVDWYAGDKLVNLQNDIKATLSLINDNKSDYNLEM